MKITYERHPVAVEKLIRLSGSQRVLVITATDQIWAHFSPAFTVSLNRFNNVLGFQITSYNFSSISLFFFLLLNGVFPQGIHSPCRQWRGSRGYEADVSNAPFIRQRQEKEKKKNESFKLCSIPRLWCHCDEWWLGRHDLLYDFVTLSVFVTTSDVWN